MQNRSLYSQQFSTDKLQINKVNKFKIKFKIKGLINIKGAK